MCNDEFYGGGFTVVVQTCKKGLCSIRRKSNVVNSETIYVGPPPNNPADNILICVPD